VLAVVRLAQALELTTREVAAMKDQEIELPAGSPVLEQLEDAVASGTVTYLTRWRRGVAAIVPADLAASADESLQRLEQVRRAQGVRPVRDPAELRGVGMPEKEFQASFEVATSGRVQPTA
jgi:hypothetical protein